MNPDEDDLEEECEHEWHLFAAEPSVSEFYDLWECLECGEQRFTWEDV